MLRTRLLVLAATLPFVFALTPRATAQTPELEAFYRKLEPKGEFKYTWKGKEGMAMAGVFRWEVPTPEDGGSFGTAGLDRNFSGLCAEVLVPITANKLYKFKVNSLYEPSNYSVDGKDEKEPSEKAILGAARRVTAIKELFGRYYRKAFDEVYTSDELIAAQIAMWEVIQESDPAEGDAKFDLFGGDFQAGYDRKNAPAYVTKAQEYLDSLTGDDATFYTNPDLRGRELIRLQGIANANGVVAQSQFALRYAGGGGVGGNAGNRPLTTGGGFVPGVGGGAPLAGFGTGAGGFGSGGGSGGSPTSPTNTATPPVGGPSTTTTPPTTTTSFPPIGGPETPETPSQPPGGIPSLFSFPPTGPTPVPAPAGLVLGAIALGTLGSWRLGVRFLRKK